MQASVASEQAAARPAADPHDAASPEGIARDLYATIFALNLRVMGDLPQRLAAKGLSPTQFKMLHRLARRAPEDDGAELSVKTLGACHALSVAAASRAIDGLVQLGLVDRDEDPADRRIKRVRITDAGRTALRELHADNAALLADFTQTLTDAERRELAAGIAPLMERLGVRETLEGLAR